MVSDSVNPEISTPGAADPEWQDQMSLKELGSRLQLVLDHFPNRRSASSVAGISVDQLNAYVKGRNSPPFLVVARLALAAGVRLDWLATGEGSMHPKARQDGQVAPVPTSDLFYDEDLLIEIIESGEIFVKQNNLKVRDPRIKARLIATLYRHACRRRLLATGAEARQLRRIAESDLEAIEELLRILE